MTRAYLALYQVTADRKWLKDATASMGYIDRTFRSARGAGFVSSAKATDHAYQPHPQRDENVAVARAANLLLHATGDAKYRTISDAAMRYLAAAPVATRLPVASVLLADYEVSRPPLHLTVVGPKDDPAAKALFQAALQYPAFYKRLEWWDTREGKLPNPDVQYPSVSRAAAYVCTERTCSAPIFKAEDVSVKVNRVLGLQDSKSASALPVPVVEISRR
jgi:uncharacterized protein YyaL (SSP411 family)